jgi:hypothetical protein
MVQIVFPGPKFNFNGYYVEEFIGSKLGNNSGIHKFNIKDCILTLNILNKRLFNNDDYEFYIKLIVFEDVEIILNLINYKVELHSENKVITIGEVSINLRCIKEAFIIVSGSYKHESFGYSWNDKDMVKFNINIVIDEKLMKSFIYSIKILQQKIPEIFKKNMFFYT